MARPTNTEARRDQIARGLIRVMARHGYDGASVAQIARAAKLTPGLVHYHFKNKQAILLAALQELVARHEAHLDEHLPEGLSARTRIARFVELHVGLGADHDPEALACWILLSGEALRQPKVNRAYARAIGQLVTRLQGLIETGVSRGELQCERPDEAAAAICAAIQGYFVIAAVARDVVPKGSAARNVLRMAEALVGSGLPSAELEA